MPAQSVAPYLHPRRHRSSPHHPRALPILTVMLTSVTVIALLGLGSLFVVPQSLVAEDRSRDLVGRFYAAANEILAGGSAAPLEDVVAPDLREHRPGQPPGDRATLVQRFTNLGHGAPGARLSVSDIVEDGEWAAARVMALGLRRAVHGVPLDPAPGPPGGFDVFRVVDDRIVDYWPGGSAPDIPVALPPIAMQPWVTDSAVAIARLTFPAGTAVRDRDSPGEQLVLLERGALGIRVAAATARFEAAHPEVGWQATPAAGQEFVLRAGDALLIPPGVSHTIANASAGAATLLRLAMFPLAALDDVERQETAVDPSFAAMDDPAGGDPWGTGHPHVRVDVLATGVGSAISGPCAAVAQMQVIVTRFTLGPGESLAAHQVEGIELLAVNPDGLEIAIPALDRLMTPAASPATVRKSSWRSGSGLDFVPPAAPSVRNAGLLPLSLIGVALRPTGGTSCAVAPVDT